MNRRRSDVAANSTLATYVNDHMADVEGWCGTAPTVLMLEQFATIQPPDVHDGGAVEIGVHHGRYLIALHNACNPGTRSLGLDLFDDQHSNVDHSGRGDFAKAVRNMVDFAREPDLVELRAADSLSLTRRDVDEIGAAYVPFRFASIDGGHTAAHVITDLATCAELAHSAGMIIVDDIFNGDYPGVTEGVLRSLERSTTPFVPLMITRKKLFMCHLSYQPRYLAALTSDPVKSLLPAPTKRVKMAGYDCLSCRK